MSVTICKIDGCDKPRKARGWCGLHWQRWRTHGDPRADLPPGDRSTDPTEAFLARTEPIVGDPGCIVWTGALTNGYGCLRIEGRTFRAHRWAWEQEHGPIPDGKVLDHICWNRACVNVAHLRLATRQQNVWNQSGANRGRSLPRGVFARGPRYMARVGHNGTDHYLGTFDTVDEASRAAQHARSVYYGEFAGAA